MSATDRGAGATARWFAFVALLSAVVAASGCRSTAAPPLPVADLDEGVRELSRPLSADPAALYRLRLAASGGLRLSLLTSGSAGRMTVSEPFGSAVSITAWEGPEPPTLFDLRADCRVEGADLSRVLGVGSLPLPQAVRLLGGRLPAGADDELLSTPQGVLRVRGGGWAGEIRLAPEPWRVVAIRQLRAAGDGWLIRLDDHVGSIPGFVRVERRDGRWAELELMTLEWNRDLELPPLPDLPRCGSERGPGADAANER